MLCLLESISCTFHSRKGGDHVALLTPCVTLECRVCEASSIYQQSSPAKAGRRQDSPAPFDCAQGRLRETGVPGSPLLGELGRRSAGYALMALLASLRHARMPGLRASSIHSNRVPQKRDGDRIAQHAAGSRFAALGRTGEAECWVDSILKFEPLQGRHIGMSRSQTTS
jgi:hypothetical protein